MGRGRGDETGDERQPVNAAKQRERRLVIAHLGLQRRPRAIDHVRRVGDNRVEHPGDAVEQVAVREGDAAAHAVASGVAPRDLQRGTRDVAPPDRGGRPLVGDRHRDAAAAGADVGDRQRHRSIRKQLLHRLDDQLGRGTGDQHVGRDLELEPPELADADDVGQRLAGDAPGDQRFVSRREAVRHRLARVGQKALGGPAEHVLRQQAGVEIRLGGRDAGVAQPLPRGRDLGVDAHETAVASLSFSDW